MLVEAEMQAILSANSSPILYRDIFDKVNQVGQIKVCIIEADIFKLEDVDDGGLIGPCLILLVYII